MGNSDVGFLGLIRTLFDIFLINLCFLAFSWFQVICDEEISRKGLHTRIFTGQLDRRQEWGQERGLR